METLNNTTEKTTLETAKIAPKKKTIIAPTKSTNEAKKDKKLKKETAKKDNLQKLNLDVFSKILESKSINKSTSQVKQGIYKYYEGEIMQSSTRSKFRRKIESISNNILLSAKAYTINKNEANKNLFLNAVKEFNVYYEYRYTLNDYSVESISNSQQDAMRANYTLMFEIIKSQNLQTLK